MRIVDIITVYIIDVSFVPSSASTNKQTNKQTSTYTHAHTHTHTHARNMIASHEYIRSKFIVVDVFQKSNPIPGGGQE